MPSGAGVDASGVTSGIAGAGTSCTGSIGTSGTTGVSVSILVDRLFLDY